MVVILVQMANKNKLLDVEASQTRYILVTAFG